LNKRAIHLQDVAAANVQLTHLDVIDQSKVVLGCSTGSLLVVNMIPGEGTINSKKAALFIM
jgi:hypothetical protein